MGLWTLFLECGEKNKIMQKVGDTVGDNEKGLRAYGWKALSLLVKPG